MITYTALQRAKKGRDAELTEVMRQLTRDVRANEPGCSLFLHVRSTDSPGTYLVIERYADAAAFEAHRKTDYLQAALPRIMACLEEPPALSRYEDV